MAASAMQLHKLARRLVEKSMARALVWESSSTGNSFRTRVGDWIVQIQKSTFSVLGQGSQIELIVTKIDGGHVASTAGATNALLKVGAVSIQPGTQKVLNDLWEIVANRDDDIDQLIKELG